MDKASLDFAPHIRTQQGTDDLMRDVLIALSPALLWGIYVFGFRALVLCLLSTLAGVITFYLLEKLKRREKVKLELAPVVTSLLVAFTLPVSAPYYLAPLGAFLAVGVFGEILGRWTRKFINPVPTSRVLLTAIFPSLMTRFTLPFAKLSPWSLSLSDKALENLLGSMPMESWKEGKGDFLLLFEGAVPGGIGEVSASLLLVGFLYLIVRKTVDFTVPAVYLSALFVLAALLSPARESVEYAFPFLCSGGTLLAALFLSVDPETCPVTRGGKISYALLLALLTALIRVFWLDASGASLALLLAAPTARLWDRIFIPIPYGRRKEPIWNKILPLISRKKK